MGCEPNGKIARGAGRPRRIRDEELLYADLKVGKTFKPAYFYVEPEMVKAFAEIVDDNNPMYLDEVYASKPEFGGLQAHPALAAIYLRQAYLADKKMPGGGVLAKQEIEFVRPLRLGDVLTSYATVLDLYEKKERKWVVMGIETLKSDGQPVARGKITLIWPR